MKSEGLFEDNVNVGGSSSNSQFLKTYDETKNWLDEMGVKKYEINKDTLVVDISGSVELYNKNLNHISVKFGKVDWWVYIHDNQNLKSLIGCPDSATGVYCNSTRIKNFNGLGSVKCVVINDLQSLESFEGLPNELEFFSIYDSCHNVNSLEHFPKIISDSLSIGPDFKWADVLYKHMDRCTTVSLIDGIDKYGSILKLLYVKGINDITSNVKSNKVAINILNAEIQRQPDPRKRNLLKVAQELSNAGFHHLTIM